jgi:hypothetical protein
MKELTIEWCPTKQMVADFMTKPIQGSHFRYLRDYIMGRVWSSKPKMEAVNVDKKINNKNMGCTHKNYARLDKNEKSSKCFFLKLLPIKVSKNSVCTQSRENLKGTKERT